MKFRLTSLADFTERIVAEYGDVVVKFRDEDDDLIFLHETNWDLLVTEAEAKRSVNLVISQRQESRISEQVIRQLGVAATTEVRAMKIVGVACNTNMIINRRLLWPTQMARSNG